MEQIQGLFSETGVTIGMLIIFVCALAYIVKRVMDKSDEREEKLLEFNNKVASSLEKVSDTMDKNLQENKALVEKNTEANKSMVNIVNSLVDSIKGDLKDVNDKVDKIIEYESSRNKIL